MNEEEIKEVLKSIEGNLTCLRNYTGTGKCVLDMIQKSLGVFSCTSK